MPFLGFSKALFLQDLSKSQKHLYFQRNNLGGGGGGGFLKKIKILSWQASVDATETFLSHGTLLAIIYLNAGESYPDSGTICLNK